MSSTTDPTARLGRWSLCRVAAELLTRRLAGVSVKPVILPSHVVLRGSV